MSWSLVAALRPELPQHCAPANDFLLRFSSAFHTCVPTPLAFFSNLLGALSIVSWLFAQLPQIYKNWSIGSTSGLSIYFLVVWCLGDLGNLLGALFTHQATWQCAIGAYYVFVDLCLVGQWFYYEQLHHGNRVLRAWRKGNRQPGDGSNSDGSLNQVVIEGQEGQQPPSRPRIIFTTPTFVREKNEKSSSSYAASPGGNNLTVSRVGPSSPMPSPSPRTMLFLACLIALAHASPLSQAKNATPAADADNVSPSALETAGTILSWMSTVLYLGSRLPQLFKNWRRKSTAGLSPHLFIAAFCGNLFYSSALLANPCAWHDYGPYGGGGWVGREGSARGPWVLAALPFFLGAFGVLGLDASVGVQFLLYGEKSEKLVVVTAAEHGSGGAGRKWELRRVSGWLRGWVPSVSEATGGERGGGEGRALLPPHEGTGADGYGAVSGS